MKPLVVFSILFLLFACKNNNREKAAFPALNKEDSLLRVLTYGLSDCPGGAADVFVAKQ
ncbi:hypothetical protein [Ilyomonas limi]|uniref:hypothetical protein n=1 Tax=Ilyomonas limi TaxID=2575867 RepID=UPI0014852053|nr:hypothetical protein [Ilyomonas limi]